MTFFVVDNFVEVGPDRKVESYKLGFSQENASGK